MNKHLYRIVFNHALGLFQVVSELVRRPGCRATQGEGAVTAAVRPVSLSLWVAFGWIGLASVASAQITTDMQAPGNQRPTVMGAPNSAPLINIQTPSAAGVSRNTYSRFDVRSEGAVLNNSRTNTQTQLAGTVAGNPWLATGTAKVILNEVTGSHPSQLNGYIEVAGDRAQVVIANPSGIACDGCGVINANRFTLTTGAPVLNGGALDGYRVTGGAIQVNGKGLDASRANYADIIARAVEVNGGIWAPQLQVTTGANQVDADHTQVTAIRSTGNAPTFALDVGALGGMYSGKIQLLGTEHGVGARNAGTIGASSDDLIVTVDGRLENTGSLQSQSNTSISANGGMANAGMISAARELNVTTPADVDNSHGTLNAGRIAVDAGTLRNAGGIIMQAGLQAMALQAGALSNQNGRIGTTAGDAGGNGGDSSSSSGSTPPPAADPGVSGGGSTPPPDDGATGITPIAPLADGVLRIAGTLDNDGGRISAASGFDLTTNSGLANDGGHLDLRALTLIDGDLSNRGGELTIDGSATVHAHAVTNEGGQLTFNGPLALDAQTLTNRGGTLNQVDTNATSFQVFGTFDNSNGKLASNASQLAINSGALINEGGTITHAGLDGLRVITRALYGAGGKIATAGAVQLTAGAIDHQHATLTATQVNVIAMSLDNRGGTIAASGDDANTLQVTDALDNSNGGTIASNADLSLHANTLGNANGTIQHAGAGALRIDAVTLNGAGGTIASNGAFQLTGGAIDLSEGTTFAQQVRVDAGSLNHAGGSLTALGHDSLVLDARGAISNAHGTISTNGALQVSARSLDNTEGRLLAAGTSPSQLQVTDTLTNTHGTVGTIAATTVKAGNLINQSGTIHADGDSPLSITVDGLLDNSQHGVLATDGDMVITATTLDNTQGLIRQGAVDADGHFVPGSSGALTLTATTLHGQGGTLASNGALTLTGDIVDMSQGRTFAQDVTVDVGSLRTAGGSLQALGDGPLSLRVRHTLDNADGQIASNGALWLSAGALANVDGKLMAVGNEASQFIVDGRLDNTRGTLAAMGATTVHAGDLINQGGIVQVAGSSQEGTSLASPLTVTVDGLLDNSAKGVIASDDDMAVTASTLDNTEGTIQHAGPGTLTIQATTLNGQGGTIASNGAFSLTSGLTNLRDGTTSAQQIHIDTGSLITAGGHLTALADGRLDLHARDAIDNTAGQIATNGALQLTASSLTNAAGSILAAGTGATALTIDHAFDNTRGTLASAGTTTVRAGRLDNTSGQVQAASDAPLTLAIDDALVNDDGTLVTNGALALTAGSVSNHGGAIQAQQAIDANVEGTLDNNNGLLVAAGDLHVQAAALINRDTTQGVPAFDPAATDDAPPTGIYGNLVTVQADVFDNTHGQLHARDALTLQGRTPSGIALTNVGGVLDGTGAVAVNASTLDNTAGQLIQRGDTGTLTLDVSQALRNTAQGLIGAEGTAALHAGTFDNRGGITFARHDLTVLSDGDLLHRDGGQLQTNGSFHGVVNGAFDNSAGSIDATGSASLSAAILTNVGGQLLAGDKDIPNPEKGLSLSSATIDNRGGTIGNRAGDVRLQATRIDNSSNGTLVAQRDLNLDNVGWLDNTDGTTYATRHLSYQNGNATLDNTGGQFGAGDTAWLNLASLTNNSGRVQADTLWLTTPWLNNADGHVEANTQHTTLVTLNGLGYLRGVETLDVRFLGDYTHLAGQHFDSNGVLALTVDGTLTNQGTLQTAGELDITAGQLTNTAGAVINAGNSDGTAIAHIQAGGRIDNQAGASIEGDTLTLQASDVTNTGDILGDLVRIDANTLTNGADLGAADDPSAPYSTATLGAAKDLQLNVRDRLVNQNAWIFSQGNLVIAGSDARDDVGRPTQLTAEVLNRTGKIEVMGDLAIATQQLINERRVLEVETVALTPTEQAANKITETVVRYRYDDPDPLHRPPYVDPSQVISAEEIASAAAYCTSHQGSVGGRGERCTGYGDYAPNTPMYFEAIQTDTVTAVTRLKRYSEASVISAGRDIELAGNVRNITSTIAANRRLIINGGDYDGSTDTSINGYRVQNLAWAPSITVTRSDVLKVGWERESYNASVCGPINGKDRCWVPQPYKDYTATYPAGADGGSLSLTLAPGQAPSWLTVDTGPRLDSTMTGAAGVDIRGRRIDNGYVDPNHPLDAITTSLNGSDPADLGHAQGAKAATAGDVQSANRDGVDRTGVVSGLKGTAVAGTTRTGESAAQVVGSADQLLPGYVPPSNGVYGQHPEADAPFLVTTAPRFAKGPVTSSDYLLRALQQDPTNIHKRLGDGYYEQNLVLDQILQLTGRRSLNGGDPMAQYGALMDGAAAEAARLGLQLGAPLTTAQIGALDSDIVWLVDQVVNGQHVLVPVVYLSKATADRLKTDGALIAGDTVNLEASGTVRNDGTITGGKGTWLSAGTLINQGTLNGGQQLGIRTSGDTINTGTLKANAIGIQAGGSVINAAQPVPLGDTPQVNGLTAQGGVISAGTGGLAIVADGDIIHNGTITSQGDGLLKAKRDIVATASTIDIAGNGALIADRDITFNATGKTTTSRGANFDSTDTTTHTVSTVTTGGNLAVASGGNLTSHGAQFQAGDKLAVRADGTMTLNAVTDSTSRVTHTGEGKTQVTTTTRDETLRGTTLSGTNGVTAYAVGDLTATAATITSNQGKAVVASEGDVNLQTGIECHDISRDTQKHDEGTFTSTSTRTHDAIHDQVAVGTLVSGDKVIVQGTNVTVTGSNVVSDHGTTLVAKNNLTLQAATTTTTQEHSKEVEKNGLMGNGGPSVTLGTQTKSAENRSTQTYATASNVGAVDGNVILVAGDHYQQIGSNVLAPNGDIDIHAKRVDITEARETGTQTDETHFRQSGLTVAVSSPVIAALQTANDMHRAAGNTSDSRMQALAGVTTGLAAYNAGTAVAADPQAGGGLGISATIGSARSDSKTTTTSDTAASSNVTAGGNVRISATGGGQDSNLTIQGSNVHADGIVGLTADNNINLLAAKNSVDTTSTSSSSSGGVGVAATVGSGGMSMGITANASASKGKGNGSDVSWTNTHISAGDKVILSSGGDTTLKGAVVDANQVIGDIKGNLNIESLQDTSDYRSKNQSLGGSVTVGMGVSGSVNASQQAMDSHYASVTEQSGIHAGDGGFQIKVGGNTDLKGGVITSSDQAVADGLNHFTTGTLTVSDLTNKAEYGASSVSLGGGYSKGPSGVGTDQKGQATTGNAVPGSTLPSLGGLSAQTPIALGASDKDSSTTRSGISGGQITITDDAAQRALTTQGGLAGKGADDTLASLNRDVVTGVDGTNALKPIFNEKEIQADFAIAGGFARETGTFINNKAKETADAKQALADEMAKPEGERDLQRIDQLSAIVKDNATWAPGGTGRVILTAVTAAIGGNVTGTTSDLIQSAAINTLQSLGAQQVKVIADQLGSDEARAALQGLVACAGAAAQSQSCGTAASAAAASVVINNLLDGLNGITAGTLSAAEKEARAATVENLVAGITTALGGDASTAAIAAKIETENNHLGPGMKLLGYQLGQDQVKQFGDEITNACTTGSASACQQTYDKWKEVSYAQGGLETPKQRADWETLVQETYQQYVIPLCDQNATCLQNAYASMAAAMVVNAGDAPGLRDSVNTAMRAANVANENWVRGGLEFIGDATAIAQLGGMINTTTKVVSRTGSTIASATADAEAGTSVASHPSRDLEAIAPAKRDNGTTVLGHYPEYVEMSDASMARRYQISDEVWNSMSELDRWTANAKFLDRTIERGDVVRLATPVENARPGSYYAKEIEYMTQRGYTVSSDGRSLLPPGVKK
ncbi:hemagglutinin repeat-containing protein [Dyella sp. EPa41]|uniref:two-partner secretion domain-containing protein n=1 Tax=Dyella sp. EPa41 TaxID=1561194 RepID=UPI001915750F|nr:hemagglutinin repeat-containing protein [Dyella sp. EPa41]